MQFQAVFLTKLGPAFVVTDGYRVLGDRQDSAGVADVVASPFRHVADLELAAALDLLVVDVRVEDLDGCFITFAFDLYEVTSGLALVQDNVCFNFFELLGHLVLPYVHHV